MNSLRLQWSRRSVEAYQTQFTGIQIKACISGLQAITTLWSLIHRSSMIAPITPHGCLCYHQYGLAHLVTRHKFRPQHLSQTGSFVFQPSLSFCALVFHVWNETFDRAKPWLFGLLKTWHETHLLHWSQNPYNSLYLSSCSTALRGPGDVQV